MKVAVVVQARTGSTRLPGKVMLPLAGGTVLQRMLERVMSARLPDEVVLATTTEPSDDAVRDVGLGLGLRVVRGHATDLLDRHLAAADAARADVVVKVPSDCPLIDPSVIDRVLAVYLASPERFDYVSNLHPATYPDGNDVEVMSREALAVAWREARRPLEREHTTPFLWDNPERFRLGNVEWDTGLDCSLTHRFVLDYPEDYAFLTAVYTALWRRDAHPAAPFGLDDIMALLARRPELRGLNAGRLGVSWYRNHPGELRTMEARV